MNDEADALFDRFGGAPRAEIRHATFAGFSGGVALVDMADSRFACDFGSGYVPPVGETVRVLTIKDRHMLFPAKALPGTGTVMTVSSTLVKVSTAVGEVNLPFIGSAPSSGQTVGIQWSDIAHVTGVLSTSPKPPDPVPDPGAGAIRSATFQTIDTGSTDRSQVRWWTGQPRAGNSTFGAWFYGTQIGDTIPAPAALVSIEFYVSWQQRSGAAPRFALHNQPVKAGIPGFAAYTAWNPDGGWQSLPQAMAVEWFNGLKAGGAYRGVGLNQGGDNIFSSRAQDAMSGAIRISWRS